MDVALATCLDLPEPDPDADLLADALRDLGIDARWLPWDDPRAPFHRARLVVIRSTWNYPRHLAAFRGWVERLPVPLWNPRGVVLGNLHKRYLLDLDAAGVPVVPTTLLPHGSAPNLDAVLDAHGWTDVVVKPAVGAGSRDAERFTSAAAGRDHLARLLAHGDVLVQPWQPAVGDRGERALAWIDGELTHAVRKTTRLSGEHERVRPVPIAPEEAHLAHAALATVKKPLLYARIDVVAGPDGAPRIMELELVEPSLFLAQHPAALRRLAAGIAARLTSSGG